MKELVWRTRNGKSIPVADMTNRHLINTVKFLQRRLAEIAEATAFWCHPFWGPQGEHAQDAAEQEMEAMWEKEEILEAWVVELSAELLRRQLDIPKPPPRKRPPEPKSIKTVELSGGGSATIARFR